MVNSGGFSYPFFAMMDASDDNGRMVINISLYMVIIVIYITTMYHYELLVVLKEWLIVDG